MTERLNEAQVRALLQGTRQAIRECDDDLAHLRTLEDSLKAVLVRFTMAPDRVLASDEEPA